MLVDPFYKAFSYRFHIVFYMHSHFVLLICNFFFILFYILNFLLSDCINEGSH